MNPIKLQPGPRQWLENSPLGQFSDRYLEHLSQARYSPSTSRVYLCCIAHFAHWISTERLTLASMDEAACTRFLQHHLPVCDCPYPTRRLPHELRAAISHLLAILRSEGAIPEATNDSEYCEELTAFVAYMRDVGGLADNTRTARSLILRRFFQEQFPDGVISITRLEPAPVRRFILGELHDWSSGTIRTVGGAIGCYLRFRQMMGDDVQHLLKAIPRVACWRLSSLPDVFSDKQIKVLLASFDTDFPSRRRAYSMVRCLVDLGLRTSEVARLQLEDVDWRQGTLRISRSKGRRFDILPLPPETGDAIVKYLQHERPPSVNRAIFVRHVAPYDLPIQNDSVRQAVFAAYKRCGWPKTGVHILRHSAASRMLNSGVPMKQIADILRHRSIDTSMIYTKVDLQRLAAVAMPWPGGAA